MMEPMASIWRDRGEARRAAQAFRDLAVLLLLLMLAVSVRFQPDEADLSVKPLPDGVQAAAPEPATAQDAEPAVVPALAFPQTDVETQTGQETQTRILVLRGDEVHEIRLPGRFSLTASRSSGSKQKVDVQVRS